MNIRISGKSPEKGKRIITIISLLSLVLLSGCESETGKSSEIQSEIISSNDNSTHTPVEDSNSDSESESSKISEVSSNDSIRISESLDTSLNYSESECESDTVSSLEVTSTVYSDISVTEVSSTASTEYNSTSTFNSMTNSVVEPEIPPVVVLPDIEMPTSPGTLCEISQKGSIDYSNADMGYISARYTGNSDKVKLRIESGGQRCDHDLSINQQIEYFPLSFGNGEYSIKIYEKNENNSKYSLGLSVTVNVNLSNSLYPYLYPNKYSDYNGNSACVYKAAELCTGKSDTIEKIAAVFQWVTDNITYDNNLAATVQTGYVPNPDKTFNNRTGICFDYASLMCAMLRSQSIPTRLVVGYASPDIYHAWNEVYTEETGWITPELMLKNAGYNIADSTFYAGASDKSQIASYISNSSNYQAIYYY